MHRPEKKSRIVRERGFTLIETFVAISILLVAVSGSLSLASRGLVTAAAARDQVTAYYLSQDAVEYVRYVRDGNTLEGVNWLSGLTGCVGVNCNLDSRLTDPSAAITACGTGGCSPLLLDPATGFYGYVTGAPSLYTRAFSIRMINDDEIELSVTVSWRSGKIDRNFVAREHLFNWR